MNQSCECVVLLPPLCLLHDVLGLGTEPLKSKKPPCHDDIILVAHDSIPVAQYVNKMAGHPKNYNYQD